MPTIGFHYIGHLSQPNLPTTGHQQGHALICDFDGTLSLVDMGELICDAFAAKDWRQVDEAWERGELSLPEAQRQIWGSIGASGQEVLAYATRHGRLRPGLDLLLSQAAKRAVLPLIASGGFDVYIQALLGDYRERFATVLCNGAVPAPRGFTLSFALQEQFGCSRCAICKGRVCDLYRSQGYATTFVGDGTSDRCAVDRADRIFAVRDSKLARYCREAGRPAQEFSDLSEVAEHL